MDSRPTNKYTVYVGTREGRGRVEAAEGGGESGGMRPRQDEALKSGPLIPRKAPVG